MANGRRVTVRRDGEEMMVGKLQCTTRALKLGPDIKNEMELSWGWCHVCVAEGVKAGVDALVRLFVGT